MKYLTALAIACLFLSSCSSRSLATRGGIVGEYVLTAVNDQQLPARGIVNATYHQGSCKLKEDSTFSYELTGAAYHQSNVTIACHGTYTLAGSTLNLTVSSFIVIKDGKMREGEKRPRLQGIWEGDHIIIVEGRGQFREKFRFERQ